MADVAELLAPVSEESPTGENLEYDAERGEIETAFDSSVSEDDRAQEIDWRGTIRKIEQQSARTKDINLPVYLCRAGAKSGQLDVVDTGAQYLGGLLETYWSELHPQLDEYGFQGRKGPCEALTRLAEFIRPFKSIVLLRHPRLGSFTGLDFARFQENGAGEDGYGLFRAALEDIGEEGLGEILDKLDSIADGIRRADAVLTAEADGDTATNFQPTYEAIAEVRRGVAGFTSTGAGAADASDGADGSGEVAVGGATAGKGFSGGIASREDVVRAIDAIIEYYRRAEPTSPVPLALARAKDWVTADFLTVLEDIASNSVDDVKRVLMSQRTSSDDY